jgi:hypothetical protein
MCSSVQIKSLQCVMEQQGLLVNPKYRTVLNNQFYCPYQNLDSDYSLRSKSELNSLNEMVPLPLPLCLENKTNTFAVHAVTSFLLDPSPPHTVLKGVSREKETWSDGPAQHE